MTTAVAPSTATVTAADRCDRCGAQAYLRVELPAGGELLFCAHHAREHGDKLREIAVNVHDETHKLVDRPRSSPRPSTDPPTRRPRTVPGAVGISPGRSAVGRRARVCPVSVLLSLLSALAYGLSDFVGGVTAKRTSPWSVALVAALGGCSSCSA